MIRLIQDCDIRRLFKKGQPEALKRYWRFLAYGSPIYDFRDLNISPDGEEKYIEEFSFPDASFIDIGKFDLAFPVFGMDEWTCVYGFVAAPVSAPKIAKYIDENHSSPETILSKFPNNRIVVYYWIDGWWESFGELEIASHLIQDHLIQVETPASYFLSNHCNPEEYWAARKKLDDTIQAKAESKP